MSEGQTTDDGLEWYVAHVRPRCEKKLVEHGKIYKFPTTLPTYKSIKKYRGKEVSFDKPLFPGYVFLRLNHETRKVAIQSNYVANMLDVIDQQCVNRAVESFELTDGVVLECLNHVRNETFRM